MSDLPPSLIVCGPLVLSAIAAMPLSAQLVAYEGFQDYAASTQVESGSNGFAGTGLNGGAGWGGSYDVNNAIKNLIKIEDRSASQVNYSNGDIAISGGTRALRFWNNANGSYALHRSLGTVFDAAAGDTLWFSVLFRTATGGASPLSDQDFFQIGFDDTATVAAGSPRVSIGANTIQTTFPSPFRFFARSTTAVSASAFYNDLSVAAATTYLLVGRIQPHANVYDTVSLFVNPSSCEHPGPPSAEIVLPSGLGSLSHAFVRTANLDNGDAYVLDEWHLGRDYGSVVQSLRSALRLLPAESPGGPLILRWPVSPAGMMLQTSATLSEDSWANLTGPFTLIGAEWETVVYIEPSAPRRFFRLRR